jgi:hypothetical protein
LATGPAIGDDDLRDRIDTIKQEVDALQITVAGQRKPWYRRWDAFLPIVVSAVAFGFTAVSGLQGDERAARAELRGLVQQLQALPRERFEINREFPGDAPNDAYARNFLGGQVSSETNVLAEHAAQIIEQLDGKAGAAEYATTAAALSEAGQGPRAQALLERGLSHAKDAISEVTLLRQLANGHFALGNVEGGRAMYRLALAIFDKYPGANRFLVASTHTYTESWWAQNEGFQRLCAEAWTHVAAAEQYAKDMSPTDPPKAEVERTKSLIQPNCGSPPS